MTDRDLQEVLRGAWARNRELALDRARRLAGLSGTDESLRDDAHKLAGALGMYGFEEAGALAVELDRRIAGGALASDGGRAEVARLGADLLSALEAT